MVRAIRKPATVWMNAHTGEPITDRHSVSMVDTSGGEVRHVALAIVRGGHRSRRALTACGVLLDDGDDWMAGHGTAQDATCHTCRSRYFDVFGDRP